MRFTESQKHTHQIVEIAARIVSARRAHTSRWLEVKDKLTAAYSARTKGASRDTTRLHLLSATTPLVLNNAVRLWYQEDYKDLKTAAKQCFLNLTRLFCVEAATLSGTRASSDSKASNPVAPKTARKK